MKITKEETNQIIPESTIKFIGYPFNFKSMYDLGNKRTNVNGKIIPYSVFYRKENIIYDSIDLNGLNGALKYDLRKPIILKSRDMVMNLGTSEHILDQEAVFRNIHNLSHSKMIHQVPLIETRKKHGYWGYTFMFFILLARWNNYIFKKMDFELERKIICVYYEKLIKKNNFNWVNVLYEYLHRNKHGKGGVIRK